MGLRGAEPAALSGSMPSLPGFFGRQSRYLRMDDVALAPPPEHEEELGGGAVRAERRRSSTRYVFACSVFASLNSVLLGYGTPPRLRRNRSTSPAAS